MSNQEIKAGRHGCEVCGYPTPKRVCSLICRVRIERGRKLIRPRLDDGEFEATEGQYGQPQTLNLAEA